MTLYITHYTVVYNEQISVSLFDKHVIQYFKPSHQ